MTDDPRSAAARALVADPATTAGHAASLWEIVIKARIGKLEADFGAIDRAIDAQGFAARHRAAALARAGLATLHRDSFDHLLIAQAAVEKQLLTDDREFYAIGATMRCSEAKPDFVH